MRLAIIDDHPLVREGLEAVINMDGDLELVGMAEDVGRGLKLLREYEPDLALVDLRLGQQSGFDLIREGKRVAPGCRFVVLSAFGGSTEVRQALDLNVDGYILKESEPEDLLAAIRTIGRGRRRIAPEVMATILTPEVQGPLQQLTMRERQVLQALGQGMSNREIADSLHISEFTVKKHVSQILGKLEFEDRTQAAIFANNHGLVS